MGLIRKLPEDVASRIAAGEVIERPSSALKELLENSLDAGAKRIEVRIEGGGDQLLAVSDDGCGMESADLALAVERHATSKIARAEDLEQVRTLGFRGEALPSIASVSHLTIATRRRQDQQGSLLRISGGERQELRPTGCAPGTEVTIRELFFNLPARRKFLRHEHTEFSHLQTAFLNAALPHLETAFTLFKDGRELYRIPACCGDARRRLAELFGADTAAAMQEVTEEVGPYRLFALLSDPTLTRSQSQQIRFFLNRRPIQSRNLLHALLSAYKSVIPAGRYPVAAVFLEMDPALFDVNVHPSKAEVKFRDERELHAFVQRSLARGLTQPHPRPAAPAAATAPPLAAISRGDAKAGNAVLPGPAQLLQNDYQLKLDELYARLGKGPGKAAGPFGRLRPIGQFQNSYLLCEGEGELVLIDQHAAHERIHFEKLRQALRREKIEREELLLPLAVEWTPAEAELARAHQPELEKLGFELDLHRGGGWLRSVPRPLGQGEALATLKDLLQEFADFGRGYSFADAGERHLYTIACHASVRARDALQPAEMAELLRQMDEIDFAASCPHGRPVFARLGEREVAKLFHRA